MLVGSLAASSAWEEAVREALASGAWVLQERCPSVRRPYCAPHGVEAEDCVWGLFVLQGRFSGAMLRVASPSDGVVNHSRGACLGVVLRAA